MVYFEVPTENTSQEELLQSCAELEIRGKEQEEFGGFSHSPGSIFWAQPGSRARLLSHLDTGPLQPKGWSILIHSHDIYICIN